MRDVPGVRLAGLRRWFGRHRRSIDRRILRRARGDWEPRVTAVVRSVLASVAGGDEQGRKSRGPWWDFVVAVASHPSVPRHWALVPTCTTGACRWFLRGLKRQGYRPWALITDGLKGEEGAIRRSFPHARQQRCLCPVLQAAGRWLWEHMSDDGVPRGRSRAALRRLWQTHDRRTGWRRFARFQSHALGGGVTALAEQVGAALPQVLPAIGNRRLRRTNNAAERCFRAFRRCARARNGFGSPPNAALRGGLLRRAGGPVGRARKVASDPSAGALPPDGVLADVDAAQHEPAPAAPVQASRRAYGAAGGLMSVKRRLQSPPGQREQRRAMRFSG
jgi:Transposase, Mutator family